MAIDTAPSTVVRTEWAAKRDEDGVVQTDEWRGFGQPTSPMTEEDARKWCQHVPGYTVVTRTITTVTTDWEPPK